MAKRKTGKSVGPEPAGKARAYVAQSDVPRQSLEEALRVPMALVENYGGGPATPLQVASALNMSPTSGSFRDLCGAAIAYGLTTGGYHANEIAVQPLAKRILTPTKEADDLAAKREAALKPRVVGEFMRKYSNSPLPRRDIALNVLVELGLPRERVESAHGLILDTARSVGFIREIKGKHYLDLSGVPTTQPEEGDTAEALAEPEEPLGGTQGLRGAVLGQQQAPPVAPAKVSATARRVFITHGKNKTFIEPIKRLLAFGELEPVVSVEKQSVSKPIPDKVIEDMRRCAAAIIHVDPEQIVRDSNGNKRTIINPNVLIEIGAAMALYGRRFILLVREGVQLASNLRGLYEVRYGGETLDGDATIRLLEAINDIKNYPVPDRYQPSEVQLGG